MSIQEEPQGTADLAYAKMAARKNCSVTRSGHANDASVIDGRILCEKHDIWEHSLGGLQHVAAIYFFELKRFTSRSRAISGSVLKKVTRRTRERKECYRP